MKRLNTTPEGIQFFLNPTELQLLDSLLKKFPFTENAAARISRHQKDKSTKEREKLLNESLAEHRRELKRSAEGLLAPEKVKPWRKGQLLTLAPDEVETLLQILNDIRVGCWRALGEPEELEAKTTE